MKFLFGFGFLSAFVLYFFGGLGGTASGLSGEGHQFAFESDKSTEQLYKEYNRFVPSISEEREKVSFMFFGSSKMMMTIEESNENNAYVSKLLKVDGQKSTRYAVRLTPIDGGNKTRVEGEVQSYPLENDGRLETMKSEPAIAEMLKRIGGAPVDLGSAVTAFGAISNMKKDQITIAQREAEMQFEEEKRRAIAAHDAQINAGLTPQGSAQFSGYGSR